MYNITLSYFVWLFWRSKEHLFRNFFFKFPRARSRDPYRLARVRCACRDLFRSIFCILPKLFHAYRSFDISLTPGGVIDIPNDMFWPLTLDLKLTNLTRFSHPTRGADTFKIVNLINALSSIRTWLFDTFVDFVLAPWTIITVRTYTFES